MSMRHHNVFRHREFASFLRSRLLPRTYQPRPPPCPAPPSIPLPPLPTPPLFPTPTPTLPPLPPSSIPHHPLVLLSSPFTLQSRRIPTSTTIPPSTIPAFAKTTMGSARKRPREVDPEPASTKRRLKPRHIPFAPVTSPTAVANITPTHLAFTPDSAVRTTPCTDPRPLPPPPDLPSLGTRSSSETEDVEETQFSPGFDCEFCTKRFVRKHHLERHIQNIHEGQRPWTCEICGLAFHQKPNLERHIMTVHEEKKPFRCNICEMSFGRKGVLKKHVQMVHEHSRKFECDTCKISFGLKSDLKRHVQSVHHKKRPFVCEVCSASFSRKSDLKRHTLSLHPGTILPSKRNSAPSSGPDTS